MRYINTQVRHSIHLMLASLAPHTVYSRELWLGWYPPNSVKTFEHLNPFQYLEKPEDADSVFLWTGLTLFTRDQGLKYTQALLTRVRECLCLLVPPVGCIRPVGALAASRKELKASSPPVASPTPPVPPRALSGEIAPAPQIPGLEAYWLELQSKVFTVPGPAGFAFKNRRYHGHLAAVSLGQWPPASVPAAPFLTWGECRQVLGRLGLVPDSGDGEVPATEEAADRGAELSAGRLRLRKKDFSQDSWRDLFIPEYRLQVVPRRIQSGPEKLVSIILLTWNQLDYTRLCLHSIYQETKDQKYELIIVDNASADGTPDWLRGELQAGRIRHLVLNTENRGVAAGWNQGREKAAGEFILIFNNDTIVSRGWLRNLVSAALSQPDAGMVGPRTNNVSGAQQEPTARYDSLEAFHRYARAYMQARRGCYWEIARLVGFCLLIPRPVAEAVGPFDERFGLGNFEDDDYCLRVRKAGYRLVVADDCFIHHFGSVSFSNTEVDWTAQMQKNQKLFSDKWSAPALPPAGPDLADRMALAEQCITSGDFKNATLKLLEILEEHPDSAAVYNNLGVIAWKQNPPDAEPLFRRALELDPVHADALLNLAEAGLRSGQPLAALPYFQKALEKNPDLSADVRDIAEHLKTLAQTGPGAEIPAEDILDHCRQLIDAQDFDGALARLGPLTDTRPDCAEAFNLLGLICWYQEKLEEAYLFFKKAVQLRPHDPDTLLNFGDAGLTLGKFPEVEATFDAAVARDGSPREVANQLHQMRLARTKGPLDYKKIISARELNRQAEHLIREGMPQKAVALLLQVLDHDPDNFSAYNNLGLVNWYLGKATDAYALFQKAISLNPICEDAHINLFDAALKLQRVDRIRPLLENALRLAPGLPDLRTILTAIDQRGKDIYTLRKFEDIPRTGELFQEAQKLLEEVKLDQATLKYLELLEINADDYRAYNGLGVIAFYRGEYEDSLKLFIRALGYNPLDESMLLNLKDTAAKMGEAELIKPYLENALAMDPNLASVRKALEEL
jgi:GT2 family glycosyltransferase/Tfp pilus assembly protein PilF